MPVLAIAGARANADVLGRQMKLVATEATVVVLPNCGLWVLEAQPQQTTEALLNLLSTRWRAF